VTSTAAAVFPFDVDQGDMHVAVSACTAMGDIHKLPDHWLPVSIAPTDTDLEVGVMDKPGVVALLFPVRKKDFYWVDATTKKPIDIEPTHWRQWRQDRLVKKP
jgi:hypothetical protein